MNENELEADSASEVPGPPAPATHYRIELLFHAGVTVDPETILKAMLPIADDVDLATSGDEPWEMSLRFAGRQERFTLELRPLQQEEIAASMEQSWQWRDGADTASRCTSSLTITHHAGDSPDAFARISLLRRTIAQLIDATIPAAVWLCETMQLADPGIVREAFTEDPFDPLFGFMNIRLYKVEGHEMGITAAYDETIMDTLGLHALGLPDLQMHFKHLDPSAVARLLDDTAHYLFEKGPVIEEGHTVRGFVDGQSFECAPDGSILDPWRLVIDIDPGKPYSIRGTVQ